MITAAEVMVEFDVGEGGCWVAGWDFSGV